MENYFDMLGQNVPNEEKKEESQEMVNLTVRADAECTVHCDGDFLFILEPGKIQKELVPVGQHILEFVSTEDQDVKVEKIVDYPTAGKNYVLIINELKAAIDSKSKGLGEVIEENSKKEEANHKAEEEANKVYSVRITDSWKKEGVYTGCLKDGQPTGKGVIKYDNGNVYEGDVLNGLRHGNGKMNYQNGNMYEGEWVDDDEEGKGIMLYSGSFDNATMGLMDARFEGVFHRGFPAKGIMTWKDGSSLDAEWYLEKGDWGDLMAKGVLKYSDHCEEGEEFAGARYEGGWRAGSGPDGIGCMIYPNGDKYEGGWYNGQKHGQGVYTYSNGQKESGEWALDTKIR